MSLALQVIDHNVNQTTELIHEKMQIWIHYELFTWRWWLGVFFSIVPWAVWYVLTRRNSMRDRLLFVGFMVSLIAVALDVLGDQYGLWHYRFNVVPIIPTYFPWDLTLMPITVMFFLQITPKANPLLKSVVFALASSLIGEPVFYWMDIYNPIHWKFAYSIPIQIAIFLIAYYFCKTRSKFAPYE